MLNPDYISLHQHSIGSLRDGIMKVKDHVQFAIDNVKKYVAITDHGSISEWVELYNQCTKSGLIPIYGIEGYVHTDREKYLSEKSGKPDHVVLLALNETGYKNLIKIHNDSWKNFYKKPVMCYDFIEEHSEGLVLTTACLGGTLPRLLEKKDFGRADDFAKRMKSIFGERFFIELMFIFHEEQIERNRQLVQIAKKHDIKTLINGDAHYVTAEDASVHQLSLLLQSNKTMKDLEEGNAWSFSSRDLFLKNEKDLYKFWLEHYKDDPIVTKDVVEQSTWNTNLITEKIEEIYLEHPPRLPHFKGGKKLLEKLTLDGFEEKYNKGFIPEDRLDEYIKRTKYELKTIENMELTDYFLLIKDIVDWCDEHDIGRGPGRGSVSASLVTWLIDITKLDPIKYNFIFERFLNPARKTKMKIL